MFRLAVFNLKDIIKYLFSLVSVMIIIYVANRYFFSHKSESKLIDIPEMIERKAVALIDTQFPQIKEVKSIAEQNIISHESTEEIEDDFRQNFFMGLINTQLGIAGEDLGDYEHDENIVSNLGEENNDNANLPNNNENSVSQNMEMVKTDVETEVVTKNPLADAYTDLYGSVKIKNETSYTLSDDILNPAGLSINTKDILIFHTHTCESYTSSMSYPYTPTGSYRTTDLNFSVARVGDELESFLGAYGFNVRHDKTYHDYPAYTGSYTRSLATVQNLLSEMGSDIIIDLHRDAIGSRPDYAPTVKIGDEYAAQVMFVMGSNGGGLYHPNWSSNLKFAVKVQAVANEMFPGLFKPIILRNSRYNQHLGKAACIIEVGSTGNTLEQTLVSMKYLAAVFEEAFSDH